MSIQVKELTKTQKAKVDKINSLLTDLRKDGVFPYVIDGGGGSGLSFIRSRRSDCMEIGDILLGSPSTDEYQEIHDKLYRAPEAYDNTIDYIVP